VPTDQALAFSEVLPSLSATADEPSTDEPAPVVIAAARPSAAQALPRISTIPSTGEPQSDDNYGLLFLLAIAAAGVLLRRLGWRQA
jgi:LPXTG-motif cell wall-anchored protein